MFRYNQELDYKQACEVLDTAMDLIADPKNWRKGSYGNYGAEGPFCGCWAGAMKHAACNSASPKGLGPNSLAYQIGLLAVQALFPKSSGARQASLEVFNDSPDTDHAKIMAAAARAAEICHERATAITSIWEKNNA